MKSKLKVQSLGVLAFSIFYAVAGAAKVFILVYSVFHNFTLPPHVGVLGVLNLITAYGLAKMRKWSVLLVTALFFLGTTFGAITLYDSIILYTFEGALLFHITLIIYLILTLVAFIYVAAKRKNFQ